MTIFDVNAALNIGIAVIAIIAAYKMRRGGAFPRWIEGWIHITMLGWIVIYLIVLFAEPVGVETIVGISSARFASIFIRPLVTLSLGAFVSVLIYLMRTCLDGQNER